MFASLREIVGNERLELEAQENLSIAELWSRLQGSYPELAKYRDSVQFAINRDFVAGETRVKENDEVAFLPPVSGG